MSGNQRLSDVFGMGGGEGGGDVGLIWINESYVFVQGDILQVVGRVMMLFPS